MYRVIDIDLPKGFTLKVSKRDTVDWGINRELRVVPEDTESNLLYSIPLLKFMQGEELNIRRKIGGIRITKGTPSSYVSVIPEVYDKKYINARMETLRKKADEQRRGYGSIFGVHDEIGNPAFGNLCQEIPLPHAGTYTARTSGPSHNTQYIVDRLVRMSQNMRMYDDRQTISWSDFDGDTLATDFFRNSERRHNDAYNRFLVNPRTPNNRFTRQVPPEPPVSYINDSEVALSFTDAVQAAIELVQGERSGPPRSRGPRPRNQRW